MLLIKLSSFSIFNFKAQFFHATFTYEFVRTPYIHKGVTLVPFTYGKSDTHLSPVIYTKIDFVLFLFDQHNLRSSTLNNGIRFHQNVKIYCCDVDGAMMYGIVWNYSSIVKHEMDTVVCLIMYDNTTHYPPKGKSHDCINSNGQRIFQHKRVITKAHWMLNQWIHFWC